MLQDMPKLREKVAGCAADAKQMRHLADDRDVDETFNEAPHNGGWNKAGYPPHAHDPKREEEKADQHGESGSQRIEFRCSLGCDGADGHRGDQACRGVRSDDELPRRAEQRVGKQRRPYRGEPHDRPAANHAENRESKPGSAAIYEQQVQRRSSPWSNLPPSADGIIRAPQERASVLPDLRQNVNPQSSAKPIQPAVFDFGTGFLPPETGAPSSGCNLQAGLFTACSQVFNRSWAEAPVETPIAGAATLRWRPDIGFIFFYPARRDCE